MKAEKLILDGYIMQAVAALAAGDSEGAARALSDRLVDTFSVIGTPEECRERMAQYAPLVSWMAVSTPAGMTPSDRAGAIRRLIRTFGDGGQG